jgi:tetratricopeptide (TPR) repeat protein
MFESVQMFVDRAQAVKPDFQVTNSNAAALAELCDRLEGIPLAIELAAARAQMLTPTQMLLQLGKRFEFLVSRKRGVTERQRTLRATVDWSYRLLSPELQRFFACLSVFRGGWTLEAAEAVCDEPLALDYLAQLMECSLVIAEDEQRQRRAMVLQRHIDFDPGSEERVRFRMLETLREFANEQLTPEERTDLQRRYLEHFLHLAEEAEPRLLGPEEGVYLNRLEIEHDNLLAALDWPPESLNDAEKSARLVNALSWFWIAARHSKEGRRRQEIALERSTGVSGSVRAKLLHWAAYTANFRGDHGRAIGFYNESLAFYQQAGDKGAIGRALLGIGESVYYQGDCEKGKAFVLEALALCREQTDLFGKDSVGGCLHILGEIAKLQGDYGAAKSYFEECLSVFENLGKPNGIGIAIGGLADTAMLRRDYDAAHSLYERGLALRRKCGHRIGIINALRYVAVVARLQGEYDYASVCLQESMHLLQQVDPRINEFAAPHLLTEMAEIERARGNYALAHSLLQESLTTLFTIIKSDSGTAFALEGFRALAVAQGQMERAARLFGAVEATREKIGGIPPPFTFFQPEYDRDVAAVRAALGEEAFTTVWAEGRAMTLEQAVALAQETGNGNRF